LHALPALGRAEAGEGEAQDQRAMDGVRRQARPTQAAQRAACPRVNA
jgi:hypothetical protein